MFTGLIFALAACFVWGMIFVIPEFLTDFTPVEVAFGRYVVYGALSSGLLMRKGLGFLRRIPMRAWGMALVFGLVANVLYYVFVVVGLRYATAPVTVLILGTCPMLIALYGNWHMKEFRYRDLLAPSLVILFGMVLINVVEVDWSFSRGSVQQYLLGLLCVVVALLGWTWYTVHNARFLKKNTDVPRSDWATIIGVATFFWVAVFTSCLLLLKTPQLQLGKLMHFTPETIRFFVAALFLGVLCSWLGCYLWNQASTYLPISLMGPLFVFETVFGLGFVFLFEFRMPRLLEFLGIASMLGGIFLAMRVRHQKTTFSE